MNQIRLKPPHLGRNFARKLLVLNLDCHQIPKSPFSMGFKGLNTGVKVINGKEVAINF